MTCFGLVLFVFSFVFCLLPLLFLVFLLFLLFLFLLFLFLLLSLLSLGTQEAFFGGG
jgi:hypothetical protein